MYVCMCVRMYIYIYVVIYIYIYIYICLSNLKQQVESLQDSNVYTAGMNTDGVCARVWQDRRAVYAEPYLPPVPKSRPETHTPNPKP